MKFIIMIFSIFLASCNAETKKGTTKEFVVRSDIMINEERYPTEIIELGLEKWYDKTKWTMYCIYCDDTCKFEKQTGIKDTVTFASLDLRFEKIEQYKDTTEINFYFYFQDSIKCDFTKVRNLGLASGAGFKKGSDSIYFYTSSGTMHRFWTNDPGSRFANPLQPVVLAYIMNNKERLHPWFREEAKRKRILE